MEWGIRAQAPLLILLEQQLLCLRGIVAIAPEVNSQETSGTIQVILDAQVLTVWKRDRASWIDVGVIHRSIQLELWAFLIEHGDVWLIVLNAENDGRVLSRKIEYLITLYQIGIHGARIFRSGDELPLEIDLGEGVPINQHNGRHVD